MLRAPQESETPADAPSESLRALLPSPIGELGVEITGDAITRLIVRPDDDQRALHVPFSRIDGSEFLDEVFGRLSEYFAGARPQLEIRFDLRPSGVTGLARKILKETAKIPFGRTRTYRAIADKVGQPDAYRVVLSTLVTNPIPILIPCHRVVTNKSGIGSYVAGSEAKRWLLEMERESLKRSDEG